MKAIHSIFQNPSSHWVGNGFPVRSLFTYQSQAEARSPFLLLDYAGPATFPGDGAKRGVGEHPHRGFETVTIVYQGEVEHRDSAGNGGVIGPGDVQWMTAGGGIMHEEFHSMPFSQTGGNLQMVQLWVNLPKSDKMTPAGYQGISNQEIPDIALADNAGQLRLIAGEFAGQNGPAQTFTPMNVWDIRLEAAHQADFDVPDGWTTLVVVLSGTVSVNGSDTLSEADMVMLERDDTRVSLQAKEASMVLLLSGEPIDEPVVGHGPFVMNTREEIMQAFQDLQQGQFERLQAR